MRQINVITLQNELLQNPSHIETILEKLGHKGIRDRGSYYQFKALGGDNPTGCAIYKNSLNYQGFSRSQNGNIFTLVQKEKDVSFPKALKLIAQWIGFKKEDDIKIEYPFLGFYKNIIKMEKEPEDMLKTYPKSVLPPYNNYSYKFYLEGISFETQKKYGIRFSHNDNSILIPILDYSGRLVGVKARNNSDEDFSKRWYAWLPYPKTQLLYGWVWNYKTIVEKGVVFIVESEKSVAQLSTMGINQGLAIGGHSISKTQAKHIKSLNIKKVVILFDEGIDKEEIEYESKKLIVDNDIMKNKIGYVFDKDNTYLEKGSKDSPTDKGLQTFKKLCKNCIYWL